MRPQNKRFFERHLEKVLIGTALVFLAAVSWYFFMGGLDLDHPGDPVQIAVGEELIGAQELEARIAGKLNGLNRLLERPNPRIDDRRVPDYARDLRLAMEKPPSPQNRLAVALGRPGIAIAAVPSDVHYDLADVPAPEKPQTLANFGVLAELNDAKLMPEFIKVIGPQVPRDFRYVSVSAVFDQVELWKAMRGVRNPVPELELKKVLCFTDVRLERQTLDPATRQWGAVGADGKFQTGDEAVDVLPLPPGTPDYRDPAAAAANPVAAINALAENEMQEKVRQQSFPPLTSDRAYRPPETVGLSSDNLAEYLKLEAELHQVRQSLLDADTAPPPPESGGPGGPNPPPGVGPEFGPPPERTVVDKKTLTTREQAIVARLAVLLGVPPAPPLPNLPEGVNPLRVRVRAHDLTVQPGTTYRYRIAVSVLSPLYQRGGLTKEQHAAYFDRLSLTSKPSVWSEPVATEPEYRTFMQVPQISAAPGRTVVFQAFRILGGHWQAGNVSRAFYPGENVADNVTFSTGNAKNTYPVSLGAIVVDVIGAIPANARVILMHPDGRLEEINAAAEQKRLDEFTKAEGPKTAMAP